MLDLALRIIVGWVALSLLMLPLMMIAGRIFAAGSRHLEDDDGESK